MKAGKYTLKDFFVNRYLKQVIIPEIQRDYVWEKEHILGLLEPLVENFKAFSTPDAKPVLAIDNKELEKSFTNYYNKLIHSSSIGFIYAYSDEQYVGRYFLIDGQQRITTLFLILLTLAHRNPTLRDKFKRTFMIEGALKLDYKVREASHDFLFKMVPFLLTGSDAVEDQLWNYSGSKNDVTINSLLSNFKALQEYFSLTQVDEKGLFSYIEEYAEFWYFDTNLSEQGEDLYIYMNARGEHVQSNENIKAELLSQLDTLDDKNKYGKEWEAWQDFFWVNKGSNQNADAGFNEFLACISGLKNYLSSQKDRFYGNTAFNDKGIKTSDILSNLNLSDIEEYISCLKFLQDNKSNFQAKYSKCEWVDSCLDSIWSILNGSKSNWYADYNDDNRGSERNKMAFLWPVLQYFVQRKRDSILYLDDVFRVLRIYYIHFNNYDRSVSRIRQEVNNLSASEPFKSGGNPEEVVKHNLYNFLHNSVGSSAVREYEEVIWEIEDHKYNLDGSVGGKNITHLLDLSAVSSLESLKWVRDKFYEVLPADARRNKTLQSILLYFGPYQQKAGPGYYSNYKFDDWQRTIRGISNYEEANKSNAFITFFDKFLTFEGSLDEFLIAKQKELISRDDALTFTQKLRWYNQHLGNQMWGQGDSIAFSNGTYYSVDDWESKDSAFPDSFIFYNTKGNLKGGGSKALQDLLPANIIAVPDTLMTS